MSGTGIASQYKGSTTDRGWWSSLVDLVRLDRRLLVAFVISRVVVVAVAVLVEGFLPREPGFVPGSSGPILTSLTSWDGFYYLSIARDGYQAAPVAGEYSNVAFAPLYPVLLGVLARFAPGSEGIAAVLFSNLAFMVGIALFVRLSARHVGEERAVLAGILLTVYPFASVFAMAYTESLFLVLMVGSFLAAEDRRRVLAGVLLALAVLCRLQGVVLALPLLLVMLRQDEWRPKPSQAWVALGPLALLGFLAYVAALTGSATGFLDAQQAWGREGFGGAAPEEAIGASISLYQIALLATLLWSVYLLVFVRVDRIRLEYAVIPVLFIAAALSSGSLEAIGRITMLAFPLMWILASRASPLGRQIWPALSIVLFTVVTGLTFTGVWVP